MEALALGEAADAGFLISSLVHEVFSLSSLPVVHCYTDNPPLYETLSSTKVISDMRLGVDVTKLREMVSRNEVRLSWIVGGKQLAHSLTNRSDSLMSNINVLY